MTQAFKPGQQKIKFYEVIEIDDCNNSPSFYHDKSILPISNKEEDS